MLKAVKIYIATIQIFIRAPQCTDVAEIMTLSRLYRLGFTTILNKLFYINVCYSK